MGPRKDVRKGEAASSWRRSDRVFCERGAWFFRTREGLTPGPYATKFTSEVEVEMLKPLLAGLDGPEARRVILEFMAEAELSTRSPADGDLA